MVSVQASASPAAGSAVTPAVSGAVDTLLKASADSSVPPTAVFNALRTLEQAKLPVGAWDAWQHHGAAA